MDHGVRISGGSQPTEADTVINYRRLVAGDRHESNQIFANSSAQMLNSSIEETDGDTSDEKIKGLSMRSRSQKPYYHS